MGLSGTFDELPLVDLVEMIAIGRKTGCLAVLDERGTAAGELDFRGGRLVGARRGELDPDKAFYALLAIKQGGFVFDGDIVPDAACDLDTEPLLIEGMRRLDDTRRLRGRLPAPAPVRYVSGGPRDALEARVLGYLGPGERRVGDIVAGMLVGGDVDEYDVLQALGRLVDRGVAALQLPKGGEVPGADESSRSPQPELER